jgi:hypothetical protein
MEIHLSSECSNVEIVCPFGCTDVKVCIIMNLKIVIKKRSQRSQWNFNSYSHESFNEPNQRFKEGK